MKEDSPVAFSRSLKSSLLLSFPLQRFLLGKPLTKLSIVSFNEMLVNKDSTSRLAIYSTLYVISLAKLKESLIVKSLLVRNSSIGIKNLAILHLAVFIADRIGQNFGTGL